MSISELIGNKLIKADKKTVSTTDALTGKKVIGLYFSAHWCPPCRGFTPTLAKFYKDNAAKGEFEIVFLSSDQSEEQFNDYFAEMPWLALPFQEKDIKNRVSQAFGVTGIPSLVFLDAETGDILCSDGRGQVVKDPSASQFPWA